MVGMHVFKQVNSYLLQFPIVRRKNDKFPPGNFPLRHTASYCVIDRSLALSSINCETMNTNLLNYHNIPRDVPTKSILIYTLCKKAYHFFYQNNTFDNAIYSIFCMMQKGVKI
jgi:hypothetical protein